MPTGTFLSHSLTNQALSGGGSITGPGAPSQPKVGAGFDAPWTYGQNWNGPTAGGSYTSAPPSGANQFPQGQGPSATMPGSIAQYPVNVYDPLFGAQQLASTLYGPQQTLLSQQLSRQEDQLAMIGLDADYKTSALHRDNALAQQSLGLDREALGVDKNLTNTQLANLDKLRGILTEQFGLTDANLANQLKGFGIDEAKARDMASRETFDLRSMLTARGAFNTVANERGTGRINRDLGYTLGQIGVGRTGAELQAQGQRLGLQEKGIGYDNQAAGLNARLATIGIDTQRLGISEQQLANSLQDGLHQIGLDSMVTTNGLLDAMTGTNVQQAQLAATILGEVMGYANLPPEVLAVMQQALLGGTTTAVPYTPMPSNTGSKQAR